MSSVTEHSLIGFDVVDSLAPAPNPFHTYDFADDADVAATPSRMSGPAMQYDEAMQQLQAMFSDTDREVIHVVLESNGGHLERTIDQLLGMTDPSAAAAAATTTTTTTTGTGGAALPADFLGGSAGGPVNPETGMSQEDSDRMLAEALQNELFLDELRNDREFAQQLEQDRAAAGGARAKSPSQEQPLSEKLKDMGEATKRKMRELALRWGSSNNKKSAASSAQYSSLPGTEDDSEVIGYDQDDSTLSRRHAASPPQPRQQQQQQHYPAPRATAYAGESKKDR